MTTILHLNKNGKTIPVEVLESYECGGIQLANVKAVEGQPFVGGDRWPVRSEYTTVHLDQLTPPSAPQETKPNLLALAMAYSTKRQWSAGESVWIWDKRPKGAFLKETGGFVELCVAGLPWSCPVFYFDPGAYAWQPVANVQEQYAKWVNAARNELERRAR